MIHLRELFVYADIVLKRLIQRRLGVLDHAGIGKRLGPRRLLLGNLKRRLCLTLQLGAQRRAVSVKRLRIPVLYGDRIIRRGINVVEPDRENGSLARIRGVVVRRENQIKLLFLARLHAADAVLKAVDQRVGAKRQHKAGCTAALKGDAVHHADKVNADRIAHLRCTAGDHRLGGQICHSRSQPLRHVRIGHRGRLRNRHLNAEILAEFKIRREIALCKVKRFFRRILTGGLCRFLRHDRRVGNGRRRGIRRLGHDRFCRRRAVGRRRTRRFGHDGFGRRRTVGNRGVRRFGRLRRFGCRALRGIGGRFGHDRRGRDVGRHHRIGRHGRFVAAAAAERKNKRCDERRVKNFFHSRPP